MRIGRGCSTPVVGADRQVSFSFTGCGNFSSTSALWTTDSFCTA
uniref:Uncharacterized protein n=1 Tax=Anguilla anguilla TaxID=7936 RepID=A0A0E9W7R0_ANGAN